MNKRKLIVNVSAFLALLVLLTPSVFAVTPGQRGNAPEVNLVPSAIAPVEAGPNAIVRFIINALIVIGVIASLVWLLWGGVKWVISGGDKAKVDSARGTIVAAIVGLIIVILAYVIINTVLTVITGSGISGFELPTLGDPEAERLNPTP